MNVVIRLALSSERNKVIDIYKRENLYNEIALVARKAEKEFNEVNTNRVIWFAEVDGLVVGVIQLVFSHAGLADGIESAILHHLRISKDFEGKGIGSQLIKTAEEESKKRNIKILYLEVEKTNERAKLIYGRLGYKYSKEGTDPSEIILTKQID